MRYAVSMPNFGVGLDAVAVGDAAAAAEAAGWDGFFLWDHTVAFPPGPVDLVDGRWEPSDTAGVAELVRRHRGSLEGFDVVVPGESEAGAGGAAPDAHAEAGATWWLESVQPWRFGYVDGGPWPTAAMADRIAAGPPHSSGVPVDP
jgi:hypothetical protein